MMVLTIIPYLLKIKEELLQDVVAFDGEWGHSLTY